MLSPLNESINIIDVAAYFTTQTKEHVSPTINAAHRPSSIAATTTKNSYSFKFQNAHKLASASPLSNTSSTQPANKKDSAAVTLETIERIFKTLENFNKSLAPMFPFTMSSMKPSYRLSFPALKIGKIISTSIRLNTPWFEELDSEVDPKIMAHNNKLLQEKQLDYSEMFENCEFEFEMGGNISADKIKNMLLDVLVSVQRPHAFKIASKRAQSITPDQNNQLELKIVKL